jgi:hypothetical protein
MVHPYHCLRVGSGVRTDVSTNRERRWNFFDRSTVIGAQACRRRSRHEPLANGPGGGLALMVIAGCSSGSSSPTSPGADGGGPSMSSGQRPAYHACDLLSVAEVNTAVGGGATVSREVDAFTSASATIPEDVNCIFPGSTVNAGLAVECSLTPLDVSIPSRLIMMAGHSPMTVAGVGQGAVYDPSDGLLYVFVKSKTSSSRCTPTLPMLAPQRPTR